MTRIKQVEDWRGIIDQKNIHNETRMEENDAAVAKLDAELRVLKRRATTTPAEGGGEVAADQVSGIYDEISLLRDELVSKITFESNKEKTNERLELLEAASEETALTMKRMQREVQDLYALEKQGGGGKDNSDMNSDF